LALNCDSSCIRDVIFDDLTSRRWDAETFPGMKGSRVQIRLMFIYDVRLSRESGRNEKQQSNETG
jgi:hypothetical protein